MDFVWNSIARVVLLLMLHAALTSCAATSRPSSPLVIAGPVLTPLPSQISAIAPPPSGTYWAMLTAWRKSSRALLNGTPPRSAS